MSENSGERETTQPDSLTTTESVSTEPDVVNSAGKEFASEESGSEVLGKTNSHQPDSRSGQMRKFFRFRLWMLFPLFIPAAFYALHVRSELEFAPELEYFESFDEVWQDGMEELLFDNLAPGMNVNSHYQSKGISFSKGIPQTLADLKEMPNLTEVESSNTNSYIGLSGYPMRMVGRLYSTVCPFDATGSYRKRFVGQMTIRFHDPDDDTEMRGVRRVGFYAGRLDQAGCMKVTLYSPDGRLIGSRTNEGVQQVFLGFVCNEEIGWLEIEMVEGLDQNYSVGRLIFESAK